MNYSKCACPHCSGHIEYELQHAGIAAICPHCTADITLPAPAPTRPRRSVMDILLKIFWWTLGAFLIIQSIVLCFMYEVDWPTLLASGGSALAMAIAYFLPALIARQRKHRNRGPIFILNFFLGWTGIGWVAALIWAYWQERDTK